jgi:glutathione synthase/RimK-type ligase-like ATP-grasp enzyme
MSKTIIVFDEASAEIEGDWGAVSFAEYLAEYPKKNEPKIRVINLCDTDKYLSRGYYCSLLAEARQHKVLPSVSTINHLRASSDGSQSITIPLAVNLIPADLIPDQELTLYIYFGWIEQAQWRKLAKRLFREYPAPILALTIGWGEHGICARLQRHSLSALTPEQKALFAEQLHNFTRSVWLKPMVVKPFRWDMAILVNPKEVLPPSDPEAIKRMIKAAAKVGIHAQTVTASQFEQMNQFDALFIRETTAIDHHTFRLARKAEQEGLVVIDDCTSILRCCNKVFLHDAFTYNNVPSLRTHVVMGSSDADIDFIEHNFDYPVVLKLPEGSFSKGVYKASNREELRQSLTELLKDTTLALVQEFLYTEFDWRIGVLNGRAIYACRYYMARNHWQIYNHSASKRYSMGGFETLPTFEVPKKVLDAALKSCALIGRGLYGVDIKEKGNHAYVIEVNDNPSIEHKVEDAYLGDELYMLIMAEFASRLEKRGR